MKKKIAFLSTLILVVCTMCLFVGCNETPDNGDSHKHSYNSIITAPTCTEQGYTTHSCTCGNHYIDSYTDALGHNFLEYVSNNDATYEKDGTKTATCERTGCGVTDTVADEGSKLIEGHTHSYSSAVTSPTCTEKGFTTHTCSCNHSYTDSFTDALTHSFTNYVSDKNATYEADGTKTAVCDRDNCDETDTIADVGSKLEPLTIQFIADGAIISTQSFTSSNRNIIVPDCPTKEGFIRERPSNAMNPNAGTTAAKISATELEKLLTSRVRRIFEVAVANGNEVLILGAFGCGAFRNPPEIVARVFYNVMQEYLDRFDVIEYAVYHTERELANFEAFSSVMAPKTWDGYKAHVEAVDPKTYRETFKK